MTEQQLVETLTNAIVIVGYGAMCYAIGRMVAIVWER